jgi:adenosylhomocysteine nucleosidase
MKLRSRLVVLFLFVVAIAAGAERPLIAVMGAYPPELVALRAEFGVEAKGSTFKSTVLRGVRFDRGTIAGHDVIIFQAGPSIVNAAYQLQMALDHFPITHVLFAGVAGGIDPALDVGDVVIPDKWAYHSEAAYLNDDGKGGYYRPDYLRPSGRENFGMMFPDGVRAVRGDETKAENMLSFPIDAALLATAKKAVAKLPPMKKAVAPFPSRSAAPAWPAPSSSTTPSTASGFIKSGKPAASTWSPPPTRTCAGPTRNRSSSSAA